MSLFNPANPSAQVNIDTVPLAMFGISSNSGMIDVTGFRQLSLGVNVPAANPPGTTIGIDELRGDGLWYPVLMQQPINAVNLYRFFTGQTTSTIWVRWVVPGAAQFGYTLVGQS